MQRLCKQTTSRYGLSPLSIKLQLPSKIVSQSTLCTQYVLHGQDFYTPDQQMFDTDFYEVSKGCGIALWWVDFKDVGAGTP